MLFSAILFPAFLIITIFVIIIPIAIIAVYLQIYKRHINNALNNGEHRTQMASLFCLLASWRAYLLDIKLLKITMKQVLMNFLHQTLKPIMQR